MADMHHLVQAAGVDPATAYEALTTKDGVTGWWTAQADVPGAAVGDLLRMSFPDAPMTWDMRIAEADGRSQLRWACVGGPLGWPGTQVGWDLEETDTGTTIRLDHIGFAAVDDMFRVVTVGWSQVLLSLKAYLETDEPKPFFDF